MPVVKTCPFDSFVGYVKAKGADQMQPCAGGGAGTGDIAAVLRDLGLYQNDIQHDPHLRTFCLSAADFPIRSGYIVCQTLSKINPKYA